MNNKNKHKNHYYRNKLSAFRLKLCYEIAPPRVQEYLEAEIDHVLNKIRPGDKVLELGSGYGRVLHPLSERTGIVVGIDTSRDSLLFGREMMAETSNCHLLQMDAVQLGFHDNVFDLVACIQNGISAFRVNEKDLIQESIRVTKSGGIVLFSSYSDKFWKDRLEWFELQAEAELMGKIDYEKTGDGVIVCRDGFRATTVGPNEFLSLTSEFDGETTIVEVDGSSLFCEIIKRNKTS